MPTGNGRPDAPSADDAAGGGSHAAAAPGETTNEGLALPLVTDRRQRSVGTNRARLAIKAEHQAERTTIQRVADVLTTFASSTLFLVVHALWFTLWIGWNVGLFGARPFDPFPFGLLTMIVSLEAIFLSIFVLMAQSRESRIAELREEITLQVNLRMEEEVTKTLQLVAGLYTRLGHRLGNDPELREMLQPLDAEGIERSLTEQIRQATHPNRNNKETAQP